MPWDLFRFGRVWLLCAFVAGFALPAAAQSWFPPTTSWLAARLKDAGCQKVRHDGKAIGGLLEGLEPGPTVVFSSNDASAAINVLKTMGRPERGNILAVFGSGVKLKRGDYLVKVEYTPALRDGQIALPTRAPSVDRVTLTIDAGGSGLPAVVVASDVVFCLQNRANTANEVVSVKVREFRDLPDEQIAIDLSLRVFNPDLKDKAAAALEEIARERLESQGAVLLNLERKPSPNSGNWGPLRRALGSQVDVFQEDASSTELSSEDFGRPEMPSITLRVGGSGPTTTEALVGALKLALRFQPRADKP